MASSFGAGSSVAEGGGNSDGAGGGMSIEDQMRDEIARLTGMCSFQSNVTIICFQLHLFLLLRRDSYD
jgi:hypothetical protein